MSVHPNNYHQDGYSTYNSYYYYGHQPPAHHSQHAQAHHTIYDESYINSGYWAEEDDIASPYSSSCQSSGESPGEITPTPSTCSGKDIYEDMNSHNKHFMPSSSPEKQLAPSNIITVPVRKKGVGGRRKNEKPPSPTVVKKRRLAANAR